MEAVLRVGRKERRKKRRKKGGAFFFSGSVVLLCYQVVHYICSYSVATI